MKERIQKILATSGVASRRHIEEMVLQGRVAVNGRVMTKLPIMVNPNEDQITLDGEPVQIDRPKKENRIYYILNKPRGVYSTNQAQGEQRLAVELLPPNLPGRVYPVGRLDAESKGLLLLTNDGDLTNQLTHPKYGVSKTYFVIVDGWIEGDLIDKMRAGVWLSDPKGGKGYKAKMEHVKILERNKRRSVIEVVLNEGRNRQVRRMLAALGHKVRDLTRVKFGPLTLRNLPLGHCRPLSPRELEMLRKAPAKIQKRLEESLKPPTLSAKARAAELDEE